MHSQQSKQRGELVTVIHHTDQNRVENADIEGLDKKVSRIFFGTAISPFLEGNNGDDLLDQIYQLGINALDTARGYSEAGFAEEKTGSKSSS